MKETTFHPHGAYINNNKRTLCQVILITSMYKNNNKQTGGRGTSKT